MAIKKSELYSSLWASCDELRGGMDASQYKDYVLTLLFMKYVSDKYAGKPNALIEVPKGGGFADMVALKGDKEIGDKINKIIGRLAEANDLKGVIDQADFNDESKLGTGKEMQDRLSKLVAIFDGLDFRANRAEGDDLLGDAYEYLMRHFATESGKSKGQFYTPAEVSRIMAQVIGLDRASELDQPTVYDPTCGSGSLLIKAADAANTTKLAIYGQEMDVATWALARMNMILHGHPTAELWRGNTLSSPHWKNKDDSLKTFDYAVANPPFSAKAWSSGLNPGEDEFKRFEYGVPPAKNGDYAFLLHLIASLKSKGKGAIILPHGVLFRGNKEADIRRNLVSRGVIKGIIGLPANLFYGTGIPACIVVIDKENAHARTGIFMIDASKGFIKDGNKNRLRAQDIHKIVDVFNRQVELPRYSRMAPVSEIASPANDYNLNLPRYIDSSEPEDLHDLNAHLNGGIPNRDIEALDAYWKVFPSLRGALFKENGRPGYSDARVPSTEVKSTILACPEFTTFSAQIKRVIDGWCETHAPMLKGLKINDLPRSVISVLSEDLLARFTDQPLIDRYDVYQRLMDYWRETMQDDVYLIAGDGWIEAAKPRGIVEDKERKIKETPDLVIGRKKYKMDLLPPALIVARYFAEEQSAIDALQIEHDNATRELEEFIEENSGDEGLLVDAMNQKEKVTKAGVKERLKAIKNEEDGDEEREALTRCLELFEAESKASRAVKDAQAELDEKVLSKYGNLIEEEIKELVVENKWVANIRTAINGKVQGVTQRLAVRVRELKERYARPLPELEQEIEVLNETVEKHLKKMGLVWGISRELIGYKKPVATRSTKAVPPDIPMGYKLTEIGVVPEDWAIRQLKDVADFRNGKPHERDVTPDGSYQLVTLDSIGIDGSLKSEHKRIDLFDDSLQCNDIVAILSDIAHGHLLGLCDLIPADNTYVLNQRVGRLRIKSAADARFVRFQINRNQDHFRKRGQGTSQRHVYRRDFDSLFIPFPSEDEQRAIAEALTDVDRLLGVLEDLIAKKQAIREGIMQQLLTGRIRLVKPQPVEA